MEKKSTLPIQVPGGYPDQRDKKSWPPLDNQYVISRINLFLLDTPESSRNIYVAACSSSHSRMRNTQSCHEYVIYLFSGNTPMTTYSQHSTPFVTLSRNPDTENQTGSQVLGLDFFCLALPVCTHFRYRVAGAALEKYNLLEKGRVLTQSYD